MKNQAPLVEKEVQDNLGNVKGNIVIKKGIPLFRASAYSFDIDTLTNILETMKSMLVAPEPTDKAKAEIEAIIDSAAPSKSKKKVSVKRK